MLDTFSLAPPPVPTEMAKPDLSAPPVRLEFPDWIEPMAATLTQERFTGPEWIFERKFDGIRLLAFKQGADVRLYSRTGSRRTIPAHGGGHRALPVRDVILDGEVDVGSGITAYHVFDVIWLDGRDVRGSRSTDAGALLADASARARRCSASRSSTTPRRGSARARRAGKA